MRANEPDERVDAVAAEVIEAAFQVHRHLGPGHLERFYEDALFYEVAQRGLQVERQVEFDVHYKTVLLGKTRVDLLVAGQVIVELKAVESLQRIHLAQAIAYLRASRLQLALLVNFNVPLLHEGIRRVVNTA